MERRLGSERWMCGAGAAAVLAVLVAPGTALAEVRHEGDWDDDANVTLDLDAVPRAEAVKKLAAAAGWSVVLHAPKNDPVSVHVKDQPAGRVLDLLLADGHYLAQRDDKLIAISPDAEPQAGVPPLPPVPPLPALPPVPPLPPVPGVDVHEEDGRDRTVMGSNYTVEKGEVVHDVLVMDGNADVWGKVTGDIAVTGGNLVVHSGGRVLGDAVATLGNLVIEDGAKVRGDAHVMGGNLLREQGSDIGGDASEGVKEAPRKHRGRHASRSDKADKADKVARADETERAAKIERDDRGGKVLRALRDAGSAVTRTALLFVFGAVLLALAPDRMDRLRVQIAARPMRSFAMGVVASLAAIVLVVALCVTIIGAPFAVIGILAAVVAVCAGVCSALETAGAALLGHRTENPYVHLALGLSLFLVLGAIPFVGAFVKAAVILTAIGSVVATRGAGLIPSRNRPAGAPYRVADAT